MDLNYTTNINSISGFYDSIATIKDDFFAALTSSNATLANTIVQQTQNGSNVNKSAIVTIYKEAANKQTELEQERANIINNINELSNYKNLLEYSKATQVEGFDTITPQMSRDSVTLYNLQYLQIFCKVLGIVIIIAIFWKYFSSITGITSLSSVMPQAASLPQAALPQAVSA
jgi:preprotein translocase subunit SecF